MSKKEALVLAAKDLLWKKGYEAMSPALIIKESGAGQGSLYHHFSGKEALALAAIERVEEELCRSAQAVLQGEGSPIGRIKKFLSMDRHSIKGCRIGRLVNEESVIKSSLKLPIQRYFKKLRGMLESVLLQAKEAGELREDTDIKTLSVLIMATIQGGYVLSRAQQNGGMMKKATKALILHLDLHCQ